MEDWKLTRMSKKQKRQSQSSIYFFDEMQDKVRTEDIKRRKKAQTNHSQPEQLFLQFKPSGKEDFNSFSNKCKSHAFESNKRPWKAPIKVYSECELNQISPEERDVDVNKSKIEDNISLCKDSSRGNTENVSTTIDSTSNSSQMFDDTTINKKEPLTFESNNSVPGSWIKKTLSSVENPENYDMHILDSACTSKTDNLFNNSVDVEDLAQHNLKVTETVSHDNIFKSDNSNLSFKSNTVDEMKEHASQLEKSQEITDSQVNKNNMSMNVDLTFIHNNENVQPNNADSNDNKQKNEENINQDFEPPFVYNKENSQLNSSDSSYNKTNNPNEIGNVNGSVKLIQRDEYENRYGENQDIINSIDMALSEGQNCNSEKAEDNDEEMRNENEEILVDSVLNDSCGSRSPENSNVESKIVQIKDTILDKLNPDTVSSENQKNREFGRDVTPEVKSDELQSAVPEKSEFSFGDTLKLEVSSSLNEEVTSKLIKDNIITFSNTTDKSETNNCANESEQNIQIDTVFQNNDKGSIEDDSCLMISHSQLLEIEKKYYETPQKANVNNTTTPLKSPDLREVNKPTAITESTQTDSKFQLPQSSQFNSLQTPAMKVLMAVEELQKRVREQVQKISRINALVHKLRQDVWPQRKEMLHYRHKKFD